MCSPRLTSGNDDDEQENDNTDNQAHTHLHVLPPHLLANSVGTTTEPLSGDSEVVGLILQSIKAFTALGDLVDVVAHHTDGVVDLLQKSVSQLAH